MFQHNAPEKYTREVRAVNRHTPLGYPMFPSHDTTIQRATQQHRGPCSMQSLSAVCLSDVVDTTYRAGPIIYLYSSVSSHLKERRQSMPNRDVWNIVLITLAII